jgi:hypothetical protein
MASKTDNKSIETATKKDQPTNNPKMLLYSRDPSLDPQLVCPSQPAD